LDPIARADSELEEELPDVSGEAGQVVAEKYRLERVIGRGAMGTVWEAEHLGLGESVAVKLIALVYSKSNEARQRFKVEATAAARLRSRFAVHVYDTGETEAGIPYLAMELLEGETLEQRVKREGALPLADVARIASQVARGLGRAHALGIVHRDLKPANIFLAQSNDEESGLIAKVLDFGIAKMIDVNQSTSTTRTGTVLGTPQFMSPEQVRGLKSLDHRADLYSLGAVVFYMLTGRLAFQGEAFGDLLLAICTRPLPIVHEVAPSLPPELDAWFQMACAREPDERFSTAEELAETLCVAAGFADGMQAFVGGAPIGHGTLASFESIPPPAARLADEMPTVRRSEVPAPSPGTVSGVLTLGQAGRPRRALWPVALGTTVLAVLGILVFTLAFSAPKHDDDADASATPAASGATLAPSGSALSQAEPSASAPVSDLGSASDASAEASSHKNVLDLDSTKASGSAHAEKRRYRYHRRQPHKPDLGF
jgi:eukaryotic-like serine/threonine-protein kinase